MKNTPVIVYLIIGAVNVLGHVLNQPDLIKFSKPMLMPALIVLVYMRANGHVTLRILLLGVALVFSWGGDLALMREEEKYFLLGLGSFLAAHVLYTFIYIKSCFQRPEFKLMPLLPILTFTIFLMAYLLRAVPQGMQLPIGAYALVITAMACMSRLREGLTSHQSFQWVMTGSLLFVVSDSAIAINKYLPAFQIPYPDVVIMGTYIAGQIFIVLGVLAHPE